MEHEAKATTGVRLSLMYKGSMGTMSLGSMCCCTYPRSFTAMNLSFHVDLATSFMGLVWQKAFQCNGFIQYLPSAATV